VSNSHVCVAELGRRDPLNVARTVERMVRARRARVCQRGVLLLVVVYFWRGRAVGKVVREDTVSPVIRGRARVKAERVVGIGREWMLVMCML
jgi:hypothetical protein